MKMVKMVLSLLSSLCLAGLAITKSVFFAIPLLVLSSMIIGVYIGEINFKRSDKSKERNKACQCVFKDVSEKDMDMLFMEEFAANKDFLRLFLWDRDLEKAKVVEVEHSKTHPDLGESDITVIVDFEGKRHGLLIEDKIDAIAMPEQYERYIKRGEYGVANDDYESFDVFIVAPEKYLNEVVKENEYPKQVSYEECLRYFERKGDSRSAFKIAQIKEAIDCQKRGYQVIVDKAVSDFWDQYISYKNEHYSSLNLISKGGKKGANATWPRYKVLLDEKIPGTCIYHKTEQGYIDLSLANAGKKAREIEKYVESVIGNLDENHLAVVPTGKSAAIRIKVDQMDFKKDFSTYAGTIDKCFLEIKRMYEIEEKLDSEVIRKIIG